METNSEYLLTFLLNASWQITIVVALAALASSLLHNGPARYRHLIWEAALLAAIIVPISSTKSAINVRRAQLFLAASLTSLLAAAVLASGLALTARGQSAFDTHMKQGVNAYNAADFRTASSQFSAAVSMEPMNISAKLYLANSLMREFYAQSQPDVRLRTWAIQQYNDVLALDAHNKQALAGMTALTMQAKQLSEAHEWAMKLTAVDPGDKSAWYTLGVLQWMMVFPEYQRTRQAAGGAPENYEIPDSNLRASFRNRYLPQVEQGMQMLQKALALDPSYDAAMAYINLLYRIKAAMVDNPAEAAGFIGEADKWVRQALEAKRRNPDTAARASMKLDLSGPPPGPVDQTASMRVKAPPPPPPPPSPDQARQIASALPKPNAEPNQPPQVRAYWHVIGATDIPAIDLYRQLRGKGFEAVLHAGSDRLTRVLAGPYFDETSASKARRGLEAAGFRVLRKWE
jgi:cell division septation protein DedD